jgi:hypothetical protein
MWRYEAGIFMRDNQKLVASGLFIVLSIWLAFTIYWVIKLFASLPDIYAPGYDPFGKLYFSSTMSLFFLCVGENLRMVGATLSIVAAAKYFRNGWTHSLSKLLCAIVALEAVYLFSIIPTAWVGPDVGDFVLVPEATIPSVFEAIFVPIPLLMTAIRIRWPKPGAAMRWAAISGVMYVFALFVRFSGQWIATFIQTPLYTTFFGGFPAHGFSYVLNFPLNMFSFLLTVVGLPLIALYVLSISLPVIRKKIALPNLQHVGLALTLIGAYFMITYFILYAFPAAYIGEKSLWGSFFTGHNLDLWMIVLPVLGVALMFSDANKSK